MSDREERGAVEGEAEIWHFSILSARLGDRLQAGPTQERHQELQEDGVARRDGAAHQMPADQKVIMRELTSTPAVRHIDFVGRGEAEAKPSGQAKIIFREGELRPRGHRGKPV